LTGVAQGADFLAVADADRDVPVGAALVVDEGGGGWVRVGVDPGPWLRSASSDPACAATWGEVGEGEPWRAGAASA